MSSRLRVVHISRGYEDYVISLASQLAPFVDLSLILSVGHSWMANHIPPQVNFIESKAPRTSSVKNVAALPRISKIIRNLRPDIIHYQSGLIWEGLMPKWGIDCKTVTTVHDVIHHPHQKSFQFTPQFFLDNLAKRSDAIIVHGDCLKQMAQTRFKIPDENATHRIGVIDHPIISRYGIGQARPLTGNRILFFGGLAQWKGIETLLPAMKLLTQQLPDSELRIAGPSSMPEYYQKLPYPYGNVTWSIRRQSDDEVRELFKWADTVVLPYIEASQSGVLHIAHSFAVPVVASDVGALGQSITHEKTGLLVKPGNPTELANALLRILTDTTLRQTIIQNMVSHRNEELQENQIGAATNLFYQSLLQRT